MPPAFEQSVHDARFAWRMLLKHPGTTVLAVGTLALAVGVGTAVFSVVNAILLQPLPYRDPARLVMLWNVNEKAGFDLNQQRVMGRSLSPPELRDWEQQTEIFERVMLFGSYLTRVGRDENPEMAFGYGVGPGFFPLLGVTPRLGHGFTPDAEKPGAPETVVLQHEFWQRRFGGDPRVVGQTLYLGNSPCTITGVFRPDFVFFNRMVDFIVSADLPAYYGQARGNRYLRCMARLKPGLTLREAQTRADVVSAELAARYPENKDWHVVLVPVAEDSAGDVRPAMRVLLVAVGCLLAIACVNVANLLLVEATARARELAVRCALGATRLQLLRLMLAQSLTLAVAGGAAGIGLGGALIRYFQSVLPSRFSNERYLVQIDAIRLDGEVVLFAVGVVLLIGVVAGLVPAWSAARADVSRALQDTSAGSIGGSRTRRLRRLLVVAEVALAVVLVVGAALLLRTMAALYARGPGFRAEQLISMELAYPYEEVQEELRTRTFASDAERNTYRQARFRQLGRAFRDRLYPELDAVPGLAGYAMTARAPLGGYYQLGSYAIEGRAIDAAANPPRAIASTVSASYFQLLGLPLLHGRSFGPADREGGVLVCIISAEFARRHFGSADPIGARLKSGRPTSTQPWQTIIGVVGDINEDGMDRPPPPYLYVLDEQVWWPTYLIIKTPLDPAAVMPAVRRAISQAEPKATVYRVLPMPDAVRSSAWRVYYSMLLLGGLAALALALALVGVYGVLSVSVRERTQEFGVRMALGADRGRVLGLAIRQGLAPLAWGLAFGLAAALGLTRFLRALLYGVGPADAATFAVVALAFALAGVGACYFPARRAARLDPARALHTE